MASAAPDELDLLLQRALAFDDQDADERWQIVAELHRRCDRPVFDAAVLLAGSDDPHARVLGLDILGQVGYLADRPFLEETLPVLQTACADECPAVLVAAVAALGHIRDRRALPAVLRHAGHDHAEVRHRVAAALPGIVGDPPADEGVAALIRLTADPDPDVRDWATFGLGSQLDVDSAPVRDALAARLADGEGDTAGEALVGLARRGDPRALPAVLAGLAVDPGNLVVEAAGYLRAAQALPALLRLKAAGWQQGDPRPAVLDDAIRSCSPSSPDPA
jgi:HEAT repeat protein